MKELTYFYLSGCPYCRMADEYLDALINENPAYRGIVITRIEERKNAALAARYDYMLVPCLWEGTRKLHEGVPTKEKIKAALDACL